MADPVVDLVHAGGEASSFHASPLRQDQLKTSYLRERVGKGDASSFYDSPLR